MNYIIGRIFLKFFCEKANFLPFTYEFTLHLRRLGFGASTVSTVHAPCTKRCVSCPLRVRCLCTVFTVLNEKSVILDKGYI